ncbi:carboxylesterase [Aspergillus venezuelensis]
MYSKFRTILLSLLWTIFCVGAWADCRDNLTVRASTGTYIGFINGTAPNVRQFLDLPYAVPPVGSRRWLPAIPPTTGPSTRIIATSAAPICPQYHGTALNIYDELPAGHRIPRGPGTQSEDCLSLSIWTPTGDVRNLPVIVFIHGGAFAIGGVNVPYQLPHNWVQRTQSHIVISINYRLGILGFPNARGLMSQNLGIMDQRLAVEWVQRNIRAFGGDPSRITLWGQSAGATSTDLHGFAYHDRPIVKGLVMESGTALLPLFSNDIAQTNFTFVASHFGCGELDAASELTCMRDKPVEDIIEFVGRTRAANTTLSFVPIPDEKVVFANYTDRYARGLVAQLPAMIGSTSDEGTVLAPYPNLTQGPDRALVDLLTQQNFLCPAYATSKLRAQRHLPTYRYEYAGNFSNLSPFPWIGAYHSGDLPYFFGSYGDFHAGSEEDDVRTSRAIQDFLLAFMRDPWNGSRRRGWKDYTAGKMLRFGAKGEEAGFVEVEAETVDDACY